ncbi:MAG: thiol:disulfide interchange protein/DsbC/DsbD-like thiol-disulfide interchange protein [Crocinitomicaceae bacterium]|jgi:thiol:disulfide interchange protein/DsbC/DsbD-like thiol-disulfide interchange protein
MTRITKPVGQTWRMLLVFCLINLCAPMLLAVEPLAQASTGDRSNVQISLISEVTAIAPGEPFWVLLRQKIRPGWHTYWRNPGDSGAPTEIDWELPAGFTAGDIQWPFPERIAYGPLMNFGYSDEVLYPVLITPPASLTNEAIEMRARVGWLVCADICIPEDAIVSLTLPTATGPSANVKAPIGAVNQSLFQQARQRVPADAGFSASWAIKGTHVIVSIPAMGGDADQVESVQYFPYRDGVIDNPAPQILTLNRQGLTLTLEQGWDFSETASMQGIIIVREQVGSGIDKRLVASAFTISPTLIGTQPPSTASEITVISAMFFAFLGGVILNLMPCVFPVLSIKILSLVQQLGADTGKVRAHGWVYLIGVVLSFMLIAGLLIGLRAGGAQIGWGFQLQSPWVIGLLVYLFFLIGLNLSGYFEIGASMMGIGESLVKRQGYTGSFLTGVLATVVAAPCTAPLMASAVGFALTQSNVVALTIFACLGLGMAAPYVILCYSPALLKALPRPGNWMVSFKEFLAFPMYATAVWLVWVLTQQAGSAGVLGVLGGVLILVFAIWLTRDVQGGLLKRRLQISLALAASVIAFALPFQFSAGAGEATIRVESANDLRAKGYAGPDYAAYSPTVLSNMRAQGPVFVNLTAAWCITCKVNEAVALDRVAVRTAFEAADVQYLKGDWTNEDPDITRLLESYGRSGVPLYLLFSDMQGQATVLPQILTEGIVLDALARL